MMDAGEAVSTGSADPAGAAGKTVLKKRVFVDAVAASSGQKKPVAKAVVDAVLAELAQALARGETVVLPPLGKLSMVRSKGEPGSEVMVLKLRRLKDAAAPEADEAE